MVCLQLNLVGPYLAVRDGPFYISVLAHTEREIRRDKDQVQ